MFEISVISFLGMMASRKVQHYRLTWANMTATHLTITKRPLRMRCVDLCLRSESCKAVNYRTQSGGVNNCALMESVPQENQMVGNEDWSLVILS